MSKFDLTGKKAIVTGGGSGIGKAIVQSLAGAGASVAILDLSLSAAESVALETEGDIQAFECNVTQLSEVQKVVDEFAKGRLDILINNAGIAHVGNIEKSTTEDMTKLFNVNVMGVYNCTQASLKHMKAAGGSIISLSSIAAHVGISDRFAYSMTKGAVHAMSLSVAKDYLVHKIRCNTISPGRVHTPFVDGFLAKNYPGNEKEMFETLSKSQPIGRMGKPEEIGALALYLASDEASYITGSDFPIDGGFITLNS
ncbi:MAG: SDR family oxidoreductase [Cyclobacteriaceae bacterium]